MSAKIKAIPPFPRAAMILHFSLDQPKKPQACLESSLRLFVLISNATTGRHPERKGVCARSR